QHAQRARHRRHRLPRDHRRPAGGRIRRLHGLRMRPLRPCGGSAAPQRCVLEGVRPMKTRLPLMSTLLACPLLLSGAQHRRPLAGHWTSPVEDFKITAIRAKLFHQDKGTFSPDVLSTRDFILWNTPIGEGSAEGPSDEVLVIVEIA